MDALCFITSYQYISTFDLSLSWSGEALFPHRKAVTSENFPLSPLGQSYPKSFKFDIFFFFFLQESGTFLSSWEYCDCYTCVVMSSRLLVSSRIGKINLFAIVKLLLPICNSKHCHQSARWVIADTLILQQNITYFAEKFLEVVVRMRMTIIICFDFCNFMFL